MDKSYWDLFWTTGLPEAWLLSRGGITADRPEPDGRQVPPDGPLVGFRPHSDNCPGGPMGLY